MGDPQSWTAVIGAVTGVAALVVSAAAFWVTWVRSRQAALVLTWSSTSRVSLENRGPADARDVHLTIGTKEQREKHAADPDDVGKRLRVDQRAEQLPVGYSIEDRLSLYLNMKPDDYIAEISWRDSRLRRHRLTIPLAMRRVDDESRPLLNDRQAERLAKSMGEGIGAAVAESMRRRRL